ncbi:hypothetical protein D3C79_1032930 [compost metagenome]
MMVTMSAAKSVWKTLPVLAVKSLACHSFDLNGNLLFSGLMRNPSSGFKFIMLADLPEPESPRINTGIPISYPHKANAWR